VEKLKIKRILNKALCELIKNDRFLFEIDANERTITHKLAEYLQKKFPEKNFKQIVVDCEYNRYKDQGKKKNKKEESVFPDIIIHCRNSEYNIMAIEVKKISNKKKRKLSYEKLIKKYKKDIEKLEYYKH